MWFANFFVQEPHCIFSKWGFVDNYRDEVSSPTVDVHSVVLQVDHLVGFRHEESCAAPLWALRCEGETTFYCDHVQTPCTQLTPFSYFYIIYTRIIVYLLYSIIVLWFMSGKLEILILCD